MSKSSTSESIKSDQILVQKLNVLYKKRDSSDFLEQLELLESPEIKETFLNTIELINGLSKMHSISECCDKPLYLNLSIKEKTTVLDFLCIHSTEDDILTALKNNKNFIYKNIWPVVIKKNYAKIIRWLAKNDVQHINTPNESGFTPGALAVLMGRENIVNMLREVGAHFGYITNEKGDTLWHIAAIEKKEDLTKNCIDYELPINIPNREGYTAAYYLLTNSQSTIKQSWKEVPDFYSALVSDAFNAIYKNDIVGLNVILEADISVSSKNEQGYTLLDVACIMGNNEAIDILNESGAKLKLYDSENLDSQKYYLNQLSDPQDKYIINIDNDGHNIQVQLNHLDTTGQLISSINFNPWESSEKAKAEGKWKILTKDDNTCYVLITKDEAATQPDLFCEISRSGELKLQYSNISGASLQLTTDANFVFDSIASLKNLDIKANEILFTENSKTFHGHTLKLTANQVNLLGAHTFEETEIKSTKDFIQKGDFVSQLFSLNAASAVVAGQLMIPHRGNIDIELNFRCEGSIVLGKSGDIRAHVLEVTRQAQILVQQGELRAYGTTKFENSGAIIGDQLFLNSGLMLTNNYGGLIKGLTCILSAPQVNQGGFLFTGQKATLSYIDWGLSFAQAGVKIAELSSYITMPTAMSLRGYLLTARTLHRAGDILYKAAVKGEDINHSEVVTLMMDNVLPFINKITSHEQQARVLVNILYQCYGSYQSEEAFIHKSLLAIETITRLVSLGTAGTLNKENLLFLQKATEYIQHSRMGLKALELSLNVIQDMSSDDAHALAKTQANFSTLAQMAMRKYADSLQPIALFNSNIQLPARELAIFALNKGYAADPDLLLQNLVFSMLHAAKQEGLVTIEMGSYIETAIKGTVRTTQWRDLYQSYQEGNLSKRSLANEAINSVLFVLSDPILRDKLISHSVEPLEPPSIEMTEPESETLSPEEKEKQKIINILLQEMSELQEALKNATTQEDRDEIRAKSDELRNKYNEYVEETIPDRVLVDINIDPLKHVESALIRAPETEKEPLSGYALLQSTLIEIQKALQGKYAAHGYLGAFADAFYNEELIDTQGHTGIYVRQSASNAGQIQATGGISLLGQETNNRTLDNKIISDRLAQIVNSQFINFESGMISAEEMILSYCVSLLDNYGVIHSNQEVKVLAGRILKNHETGQLIAKKEVDLLCDLLSENKGLMSGEKITMEGTNEGALNLGTIYGIDKIRLISEKLASNEVNGELIASQVIFESKNVNKEGAVMAALVDTKGYDQAKPDNLTWKKHDHDVIGALLLKPKTSDYIETDAFSKVSLLDVTLEEPFKDEFSFEINPDFANILQLHFPHADTIIPMSALPQLSDNATLIVDAPGHDLDATGSNTYSSGFRFTGNEVRYSGGNTSFTQTVAFAVNKMVGQGGETKLYLQKGGFFQAEEMLNQGLFDSDGIVTWNLKKLNNDAVEEKHMQYFYENKRDKKHGKLTSYEATRVMENSGTIYAIGHRGHLGEFNQHGGMYLSGEEGTFVYHSGGHQKAILTYDGRQTSDEIQDGGRNWHVMPIFDNAEISSIGQNTFIGKEAFTAAGLNFEGDKGAFLYAAQGIKEIVQSEAYHISETQSRRSNGKKFQKTVHPYEHGYVTSQNNISSKNGDVHIFAPDGSIKLDKTIVDSGKNAIFVAKDKVSLEGVENTTEYKDRKKRRKLLHSKKTKSATTETKIERSYVFTKENLTIVCEELVLNATWVNAQGGMAIMAKTTTLDGKKQTFDNKTQTIEYSFSMPALDNLQSILKGKNAKDIFGQLMRSFGWNEQELQKILHAKSVTELPGSAVRFARDSYNLTSFVSHACGELGKSPTRFLGAITDKLGLTTVNAEGERIPNPRFSFRVTKTKERTQASQSVPTEVIVGGTFSLLGDTLYLREGSKVDAENLRVFLIEGIKATYGAEIFQYSRNSQTVSLGVSALNPYDVEIALGLSKQYQYDETHHNAKLHARSTAEVHAGQTMGGNLQIDGINGSVTAPYMHFESTQDKHITKTLDISVNVSTTGSSAGANMQKGKTEEYVTRELAGIVLKNGEVKADHIHLENGSQVIAKQLHRVDGEEGLPTVTGTDVIDSKVEKSKGFGFQVQPNQGTDGNPGGSVNYLSDKQETLRRATVLADNLSEGALLGMNTDSSKQTEVITDKRKALDLEGSKSDIDKITDLAKKPIPFLSQSESKESPTLSSDNSYVQQALVAQQNELFSDVLNLGKDREKETVLPHTQQPKTQQNEPTIKSKASPSKPKKVKPAAAQPAPLTEDDLYLFQTGAKQSQNKRVGRLSEEMVTYALNPQLPSEPCTTRACEMFDRQMYLNRDHDALSTMYIAAERSITSTGQGIKQLAFNLGEKMDLVEEGTTAEYTQKINEETSIYRHSAVGQSKLAKTTEFLTDFGIGFAFTPLRAARIGGKLFEGAVGGIIQEGLGPTEDGHLLSNLENGAKGVFVGVRDTMATSALLKTPRKTKELYQKSQEMLGKRKKNAPK